MHALTILTLKHVQTYAIGNVSDALAQLNMIVLHVNLVNTFNLMLTQQFCIQCALVKMGIGKT